MVTGHGFAAAVLREVAMRILVIVAAAICGATLPVLHAQTPPPPRVWSVADAPAEFRYAIGRADLVIASLQDALIRELSDTLKEGGPTSAVQSCHLDVIGLTQRIAREQGVAAGRTSDRLRSPTNAPRPWAAALVKTHAGRQAREVDGFVVNLGNTVGILRPIAHRPMCASCHGPEAGLAPGVRAALHERYPTDRAVGFREGEIRGWFWVEMPKVPRR